MQSAWEKSGKFEGDIMLTEEQKKELFNNVVPVVTDDVFSEYCSTNLQSGIVAWREISIHYEYRFISSAHWRLGGRSNGDNCLCFPLKIIAHSQIHINTHTHTCQASHVNKPTILRLI